MTSSFRPLIVGIGGTTRPGSSSEKSLRYALALAETQGAATQLFVGANVNLPMYAPESPVRTDDARNMLGALRRAHGVILATPCYHGSVSGLIKNALDYTEDMHTRTRCARWPSWWVKWSTSHVCAAYR